MKKALWLFLLILCLPVLVNAKTIRAKDATPKDKDGNWYAVGNNVFYMLEGNYESMSDMTKTYRGVRQFNNKDVTILHYNAQIHAIKYNNIRYNSICLDPGLANSSGDFTCESIEMQNYSAEQVGYLNSIKYLLKNYLPMQHENYIYGDNKNPSIVIGLQMAVRAYAYQAQLGVNKNEINTSKAADNRLMNALTNRIAYGITTGSTLPEGAASKYENLTYSDSKIPKDKKYIEAAVGAYTEAKNEKVDDNGVSEVKLDINKVKSDLYGKSFIYNIKSLSGDLDKSKFSIICISGCNDSNLTFIYSGQEGKLLINGVERFDINITYNMDNSVTKDTLYLCYKKDADVFTTTNQKFLTLINEPVESVTYNIAQKRTVTCSCGKEDKDVEQKISMCCNDNIESYVIQPKINLLFCDKINTDLKISGYVSRCGDLYKVSNDENGLSTLNDYCELYCTERIKVTVPDSVEGNNGKYFKLKPVSGHSDSTGPYLEGKRTCRLITHYDVWVNDYKTETDKAVDNFNTYQKYQAYHDMYQLMYDNTIKGKTKYGKSDHEEERTVTYKGTYPDPCDSTKDKTATCTRKYDCTVNYTAHITDASYTNVTYRQAKMIYSSNGTDVNDSIGDYKGFYIWSDDNYSKTTTKGPTGYYETEWASDTCGKSSSSVYCAVAATECLNEDGTKTPVAATTVKSYYDSISSGGPSDVKGSITSNMNTYSKGNVEKKAGTYNTNVDELNKYENYLNECTNYFVEGVDGTPDGIGAAKNNDADHSYKLYKLNPTINFVYFTTYLDSNNESQINDKPVLFDNIKCTYKLKDMKEDSDADLGLEGYHYNTFNSNKEAKVKNFNVKAEFKTSCLNNSSLCTANNTINTFLDTTDQVHSQRYTNDAYYQADCSTNTSSTTKSYVIYPFGSFTTTYSNQTLASNHNSQYFIEYSAFYGEYETYWTFEDLGNSGKHVFDQYFKPSSDKPTCSETKSGGFTGKDGSTNNSSLLTCTLSINSSLTRLSGCDSSSVISLMDNSSNNWSRKCCNNGSSSVIGKCDIEDPLSFMFKTVDSVNIFPDNGLSNGNKEYGYNWLKSMNVNGTSVPSVSVKNEIETRAAKDLTFDSSRISYEFNLTITDLEAIRKYNDLNSYNDFKLSCKEIKSGTDIVGYYDCQSTFITNYYNGFIKTINDTYNVSYGYGSAKLQSARSTGADAKRHIWPK